MLVLAIDTASPAPAVALADGASVFEERLPSDRSASEDLLPAIERLLAKSGRTLASCERIAVCSGPGSFTGLRVGLATAWGLARALQRPVESVSTLEAMAEAARELEGSRKREAGSRNEVHPPEVLVALDAGRGEVSAAIYALSPGRAREVGPIRRLALEEVASFSGDHVRVALPTTLVPGALAPAGSPASALALAVSRAPGPEASALSPIYSRLSAAEEKHGAAPA
jgi:tRNA threonylcarbamoyladenosine biosynthesis protein TsaB